MPFHTVELKEQNETGENGKEVILAFSSIAAAEFFPIGKTFSALKLLDTIAQARDASSKSLDEKVKGEKQEIAIMKKAFGARITENILDKATDKIQLGKEYLVTRSEEV